MILKAIKYKKGAVFVDEQAEIKEGDWYAEHTQVKPDRFDVFKRSIDDNSIENSFKIVAQHNLSIPDIAYVELEEDVNEIARRHLTGLGSIGILQTDQRTTVERHNCFVLGYKAAQAKKWTNEDMKICWNSAHDAGWYIGAENPDPKTDKPAFEYLDDLINYLKPEVDSIELDVGIVTDDNLIYVHHIVPFTYQKDGKVFLKVKSINYK